MTYITLDTESTGRKDGQICQLALLMAQDGAVQGRNLYFAVDEMDEHAFAVHGLSKEALDTLSGGVRFADRAGELYALLAGADLLVGHNISSDVKALKAEFARCGLDFAPKRTFCTMNRFTKEMGLPRRCGRGPKPPRLMELAAYFGLTEEEIASAAGEWFGGGDVAHDARFDAAATWLCLARSGVDPLAEVSSRPRSAMK